MQSIHTTHKSKLRTSPNFVATPLKYLLVPQRVSLSFEALRKESHSPWETCLSVLKHKNTKHGFAPHIMKGFIFFCQRILFSVYTQRVIPRFAWCFNNVGVVLTIGDGIKNQHCKIKIERKQKTEHSLARLEPPDLQSGRMLCN